jgi:uncharacterized protein (DUF885 family)
MEMFRRDFLIMPVLAGASVPPCLTLAAAETRSTVTDAATALTALFADDWERGLREDPERASEIGDTRYNDRWTDRSLAAILARQAADRAALERLRAIDRAALAADQQLNYDTFVNEIDRYIGDPAQALAYKIGQIKISQLRARAQRSLGSAFDLRDYNDAVLAVGSVPLTMLETHIDRWIRERQVN